MSMRQNITNTTASQIQVVHTGPLTRAKIHNITKRIVKQTMFIWRAAVEMVTCLCLLALSPSGDM